MASYTCNRHHRWWWRMQTAGTAQSKLKLRICQLKAQFKFSSKIVLVPLFTLHQSLQEEHNNFLTQLTTQRSLVMEHTTQLCRRTLNTILVQAACVRHTWWCSQVL